MIDLKEILFICSSKHIERGKETSRLSWLYHWRRNVSLLLSSVLLQNNGRKKTKQNRTQKTPNKPKQAKNLTEEKLFPHGQNSPFLSTTILHSFHMFSSLLSPESLVQQQEQNLSLYESLKLDYTFCSRSKHWFTNVSIKKDMITFITRKMKEKITSPVGT